MQMLFYRLLVFCTLGCLRTKAAKELSGQQLHEVILFLNVLHRLKPRDVLRFVESVGSRRSRRASGKPNVSGCFNPLHKSLYCDGIAPSPPSHAVDSNASKALFQPDTPCGGLTATATALTIITIHKY